MKRRAKDLKENYDKCLTGGKDLPLLPTVTQGEFLEQTKNDLSCEMKKKEEDLRMKKHAIMAVTGTQFLQKEESIWFWNFLDFPEVKKRCANHEGPKRVLIRQFISEYPYLQSLVNRLLERKQRKKATATENNVINTLIASWSSFMRHSRF